MRRQPCEAASLPPLAATATGAILRNKQHARPASEFRFVNRQNREGLFNDSNDSPLSRVAIWTLVAALAAAAAAAEEPFNYFRNDWNVVGLKDYQDGTRITPENRLLLAGKRELEIRVGRNLAPLGKEHTKTLLEGWMPIVLISAGDGPVRYKVRIWASPLPSARDWKAAFDWPTEGENYLNFVQVSASNRGDQASEAAFEIFLDRPEPKAIRTQRWNLAPGESAAASAWIPFAAGRGESSQGH